MSLWRDELRPSRATVAALVALALVAVASLSRVVQGPAYLWWALPALGIGCAFAWWFGHRSLGVGFGLLLFAAFVTLPELFLRGPHHKLFPTPSAIRAVRALFRSGFDGIPKATPPVGAEAKYLVLVWTACLLLGFLGTSWVVVHRPVGAVISALAVVTFTGSVGGGAGRPMYAIAAVAVTVVFFLLEGRQRIERWSSSRAKIPPWLGVPTLAAACLGAFVAPFIFGDRPILQLQSALHPRLVIIKPLSDIKRQLKVDPPIEVMRVQSDRPTYWRLTGLDTYDGHEWLLEAHPQPIHDPVLQAPNPPTTGRLVRQRYRLTSLLSPWAPAAYAATSIDSSKAMDLDRGSQTLLLEGDTTADLSYSVMSRLALVTQNLPAAPRKVSDPVERYFGSIARPVVAGAKTPLDIARRLEAHFRAYTYSEDVPAGHSVDRLKQFLRDRTGYCEQFAATMTLMLRGLGVPARVGVGFLPGSYTGSDYIVSTKDAHAWVEADVPGAGWTNFDPTPGRGNASAVPQQPKAQSTKPLVQPQTTAVPQPTPVQQKLPQKVTPIRAPSHVLAFTLWALLLLVVGGLVPGAKRVRSERRRRGAGPDDVVVGAYDELVDRAGDLGWSPARSETTREFVARAFARDEHATAVAVLTNRAMYSPGASSAEDATSAWRSLVSALRALRLRSPVWRRALAIYDPRTFVPKQTFARVAERVRTQLDTVLGRA